LFEWLDESAAQQVGASLRAWPWEYRSTGQAAFAWTPAHALLGHVNADGRFSGLDARPTDVADTSAWRAFDPK
jgi:hypothetical protein